MTGKHIRVLIGKPGLDGHDVGAKIVARELMNAGFEVIYTGLKQSLTSIANAARDEDVDVIGLSILSGSHLPLCRKFQALMAEKGIQDKLWLVGGNIPEKDKKTLEEFGVRGVFPFGTRLQTIVDFIRENVS